jgi:hypothetical protein
VLGIGASGRTYSFAETHPEVVLPMGMTSAGSGGGTTYVTITAPITVSGGSQSADQIAAAVSRKLGSLAEVYARSAA